MAETNVAAATGTSLTTQASKDPTFPTTTTNMSSKQMTTKDSKLESTMVSSPASGSQSSHDVDKGKKSSQQGSVVKDRADDHEQRKGDHYKSYHKRNRERFHGRDYHDNDETRERDSTRYRSDYRYPEQQYRDDRRGNRYRRDRYEERHETGSATGPVHRGQRSKVKGRDNEPIQTKTVEHKDKEDVTSNREKLPISFKQQREDGGEKVTGKSQDLGSDVSAQRMAKPNELRTGYKQNYRKPKQFDHSRQFDRRPRGGRSPREQRRGGNDDGKPLVMQRQGGHGDTARREDIEPISKNDQSKSKNESPELIEQSTESLDSTTHPDSLQKPVKPDKKDSKKKFDSHDYTKQKPGVDKRTQNYHDKKPRNRPRVHKAIPTIQSDQLAQELTAGTYECMVCCDRVRGRDQVWSCESCYHVFHLRCIKKWASAPRLNLFDDEGE